MRLYAEEHVASSLGGRDAARWLGPRSPMGSFGGLRRFAFNRNPRAANTPACVPRRYEFIVYIERASSSYTQTNCTGGKLQRLYSSNGSCSAACAPLQYTARSTVPRIYVHKRPDDTRGWTSERAARRARRDSSRWKARWAEKGRVERLPRHALD